eukprot:TRINITY_DN8870_c0_g1_i5.p1 TRINITY_DN8870_c0_g1~~TRINITY_DN8870_c0_g1_i5.p1  ORF type:complete len:251 (-),score=43.24 TRINITY_DN8870_c0_g1_i5:89-841(-)
MLVCCKTDSQERVVSEEHARVFADSMNAMYSECSAKTGANVVDTFDTLIKAVLVNEPEELKFVLLGPASAGKTCVALRCVHNRYEEQIATVGASFLVKKLTIDGREVNLAIWDTAGQERFRCMLPMYYRGAHAGILCYDISDSNSFRNARTWLPELQQNLPGAAVIGLVGCKKDMEPRAVPTEEALAFASSIGAVHAETSSKTGEGIDDAFVLITRLALEAKGRQPPKAEDTVVIHGGSGKQPRKSGRCC